jgi:hypothetical protein
MKKEFKCFAHGFFEADEPRCPYGCSTAIERAFLTPPAIGSQATRNIDATLHQLARDYGFSNMTNRRGNGSVAEGAMQPTESQGQWVEIPKGNQGINQALTAQKANAGDAALDHYVAQHHLTPPPDRAGVTTLPRPTAQIDPHLRYGKPADIAEAVRRLPAS